MRKSVITLLFPVILLFSFNLDAQQFFYKYGDKQFAEGHKVISLKNDKGFAIVGSNWINGYLSDVYLVRTNERGDTMWTRAYGSVFMDAGYSITETQKGGFVIAGKKGEPDTLSEQLSNSWLIRTDSVGDTIWTFELDSGYGEIAFSVEETSYGTFFLAGVLKSCVGCNSLVSFLASISEKGELSWINTYPTLKAAFSTISTNDSGFVLAGYTGNFPPYKLHLIKTDRSGNELWRKENNWGVPFGQVYDISQNMSNEFVITGASEGNLYLCKLDSAGNLIWYKTYGGNLLDVGKAINLCRAGGYIVTGFTSSFASGDGNTSDIWLLRLDENGDTLWTRTYGTNRNDVANDVIEVQHGGFVITGSVNDEQYAFLLKTDSLGNAPDISTSIKKNLIRNESTVIVYPNPASDELNLKLQSGTMQKPLSIRIYDINGKVLKNLTCNQEITEITIDVKDIRSGIYLLQIITPASTTNYRIIKE